MSPKSLIFWLLRLRVIANPIAIRGSDMVDKSYENPKRAIIQEVIVVPILAPIITPIA